MASTNRSYNTMGGGDTQRSRTLGPRIRPHSPKMPSRTIAEDNMSGFMATKVTEDVAPMINKPQRIELPVYFNTPRRYEFARPEPPQGVKRDQASIKTKQMVDLVNHNNLETGKRVTVLKRLKDYKMLAFACKRAGKARDEGRAYYSIGVLFDNVGNYRKAISQYQKFLSVCKSIGDTHGEALAYNCIGVDYQKLAENSGNNTELWEEAANYHLKHKEISDVAGKFLAHINLGVIYQKLGDVEKSSINHQFALRYAIQMSSVTGQSVAIGNLGQIGSGEVIGDNEKLKMFVERYLNLSQEMKNRKGEGDSYAQLGNIATSQGDFEGGTRHFYRAMKIAEEINDRQLHETSKCNFGIANANLRMEEHKEKLLGQVNARLNSS